MVTKVFEIREKYCVLNTMILCTPSTLSVDWNPFPHTFGPLTWSPKS